MARYNSRNSGSRSGRSGSMRTSYRKPATRSRRNATSRAVTPQTVRIVLETTNGSQVARPDMGGYPFNPPAGKTRARR